MDYIKIKLFELFLYQPPCYANNFVNNLENARKRVNLEIANLRQGHSGTIAKKSTFCCEKKKDIARGFLLQLHFCVNPQSADVCE